MILDLILIMLIMVNLVDISGFKEGVARGLWKYVFRKKVPLEVVSIPKPFSCSYCMTHHTGLLYMLIVGKFTLYYYAFLLLLCFLTPIAETVMRFMKDMIAHGLDKAYRWLYKDIK